jgi:hypothetical protein
MKTLRNLIIAILFAFGLTSCEALKKSICENTTKCYDTVTYLKPIPVPFNDTIAFVSIERRDTIPIFKGTKIFVGSSADSMSKKDSMRYFSFEIFNYGDHAYVPTEAYYYNIHFDLEINKIIMFRDTLKLGNLSSQGSRYFKFHFPVAWFKDKLNADVDYHYRIAIKDNTGKTKDIFYPRPLNPKLPEKRWDEITKDSIIYWARPVIVDTTITVKRPVYAYRDSLIFIDDIIGCKIYSHIFFGGNKIYSFVADTCTKRLYSDISITNNNTESISALVIKAYSSVATSSLQVYVNDTLLEQGSYSLSDSLFVGLVTKPFSMIKSVKIASEGQWTVVKAQVNNYNLFSSPSVILKGVNKVGSNYVFTSVSKGFLTASWLFNGNGNDETGKYPLTLSNPAGMFDSGSAFEGSQFISYQASSYYANAGIVPLGDAFTICFAFETYNNESDARALLGNAKVYYPDGYIFYIDEISKLVRFVTGDGTYEGRKFIFSTDASWTSGRWVHVAITASRLTGTGKMYINGIDRTRPGAASIFKPFKDSAPLFLGRSSDGSLAWCYMDAVKIYNKELTPAEITKVYKGETIEGSGVTEASLYFNLK